MKQLKEKCKACDGTGEGSDFSPSQCEICEGSGLVLSTLESKK